LARFETEGSVKQVKDLMQKQVFSVRDEDLIDRVFFLFHYEKIRHVPVLDGQKIVGMVSDRDLYKALGPRSHRRTVNTSQDGTALYVIPKKVRHIMRRGVITVEPETDLGEAANLMAGRKVGALPVVRGNKLVGIVTATDLLRAFAKLVADVNRIVRAG
jgi:acetoin utilization protein AcuB